MLRLATAPALLMVVLLAACGESGPTLEDPDGLVRFTAPTGWEVRSESNGLRLGRADAPDERTVLFVTAREAEAGRTLETLRETRRSQSRSQNLESVVDERSAFNGFEVWETFSSAGPESSRPSMHSFHLFSDEVQVEVGLIATPERHDAYVEDLRAVARSIRAN